ncbi:hypothetical protein EVJ27_13165 [Exiguobacterium sp. SH3S2]|uniref:hypothetical protein n=1 Tax=unclassified Exiguobacterium TaxID=2644629 RepID=UPI00103FD1E2|nr:MULTISPECIES: hypothetical protein [unclassified Exiguobacterium]TCI42003.1 hypothetical protein EVJ28_13260 [Exiguobacterium sp. SH3S3]TCI58305.1 hypothetical protein EVJ27_13165 [Exiguobacterium sp. SH3S2]
MSEARYFETAETFRHWLQDHPDERELWVEFRKGEGMEYIESVYEALCFGWIDGQVKNVDGTLRRRFAT